MKSTPTPWKLQTYTDAYTNIIRPESNPGAITCSCTYRTDAELIVKAVNSYDEIQELLKDIRRHGLIEKDGYESLVKRLGALLA